MFQDKALLIALAISAALHISTISLFSIGVWFPVEKRVYHRFDIVEEGTGIVRVSGEAREIDMAELDTYLSPEGELVVPSLRDRIADVIQIQAPTIDFGGLERGQLRREGLQAAEQFQMSNAAPSLATSNSLGNRLETFTSTVRGLNPFRDDENTQEEPEPETGPVQLDDPAPGYEAFIDWLIGERDRLPLLPLSIPALRDVDPAQWTAPVSFVIKVDPSGRVIEALTPPVQESPIMAKVGLAVLQTRFRSLSDDDTRVFTGTLIIRAKAIEE